MKTIKAVIFDMDGVLIDAKEWHYEALNRALAHFGFCITRYEHISSYDGLPTMRKLEMLSVEKGFPRALHKFLNDLKQQYTLDVILTRCKPYFQHQVALSKLKQDGYKLAVASNSVRISVESMMRKSALSGYLDLMMSNQDVDKPKPDPEMYIKTIQKLNLEPGECLILEDNENGIRAARDSGAHVLEVSTIDDVEYENIIHQIRKCEGHNND